MDVAVRLAVPVGLCRWRDSPSCYSPFVKMTYDLRSSGWAVLSSEQEPITDGEIERGLVTWPSDFGEAKGACEIALVGRALHEHRSALRVRVGATTLDAQSARALGPIGRGGGRSYFAIESGRTAFPSLPLEIVVEGVGETIRCAIPVPAPDIALVLGRSWAEAQRIRPFIDEVLVDPIRRRAVLVFRGFFTHPGDVHAEGSLVVDALGKLDATAPREIARWPKMSALTPEDLAPDERTPLPRAEGVDDDAPTPDSDSRPSVPMERGEPPLEDDGETTGEQVRYPAVAALGSSMHIVEPTVDGTIDAMETTSRLPRSPVAHLAQSRPRAATVPASPPTEDVFEIDPNEAEELLDDDSTSDPPVDDPSTTEAPPEAAHRGFDRTMPMPRRRSTPPIGIPFTREPAKVSPVATTRMPVFGPPPGSRKPARTQQMTAADLPPELAAAPPRFGAPPVPPAPPTPADPPRPRFKDDNESTQLFVLPTKPEGPSASGLPFAPAPKAGATPPRRSFSAEDRVGSADATAFQPATRRDDERGVGTIPPPPDTPSERRTAPPPPMPSVAGNASPPAWAERAPSTAPPPPPVASVAEGPATEAPPRGPSTAPPPPPAAPRKRSFDNDEHTAQIQIPVAPRAPLPFVEGGARGLASAPLGFTAPAERKPFPPTVDAPPAADGSAIQSDETQGIDDDRRTAYPPEAPRDGRATIPPPAFAPTPGAPDWFASGAGSPAPPAVAARLDALRTPPPVEASTIPTAPQWKPRVVEAPAAPVLASDVAPTMTLEEYAALRAELWSGARSRRDVLKSKGLSELRWRAIERKFAREIDAMSGDPSRLLPLLSRLESASR